MGKSQYYYDELFTVPHRVANRIGDCHSNGFVTISLSQDSGIVFGLLVACFSCRIMEHMRSLSFKAAFYGSELPCHPCSYSLAGPCVLAMVQYDAVSIQGLPATSGLLYALLIHLKGSSFSFLWLK